MLALLQKHWWVLALRGALAVLLGVIALVKPGVTLATLVLVFGAYTLIDGVVTIANAIACRKERDHWGLLLLEGLLGVGVGIVTLTAPEITAVVLLMYIAAWWLVTGAMRIVAAIRLRKEIEGEWLMALSGVVSIACAVILMRAPAAGVLAFLGLIASFAIIFGIFLMALAFRVRNASLPEFPLR